MENNKAFIYISNKDYDGTVYITQILEWLHEFKKYGLKFNLIQAFHVKSLRNRGEIKKQLTEIQNRTDLFSGYTYFFPSKGFGAYVNSILIFVLLFKYFMRKQEVLIFSRALLGREIEILKRITSNRISFIFDARAASAEENKYSALREGDFSKKRDQIIANIYRLEYETITIADKVFTVSNGLRDYFINTFAAQNDKFVIYPCLADETKFYYSPILRSEVRKDLGIEANVTVIIYSGGVKQKWHKLDHMLTFFKEFLKNNSNSKLLLLTNDQKSLDERLVDFYDIISHVVITSVPNQEVVNYLNAADFGLLFRDNTPMNNVASPTKFAEYMLCGLPVIISEGVGDYTNFTSENNVGVVLSNDEFNDMAKINFTLLTSRVFDRHYISQIGKECFSKSVLASHLVKEFIL